MKTVFDGIIIGGSYAGLSAAMALGRSLRQVLIIDSNQPCNRFTSHSHNFITQDGKAPAVITQAAQAQVLAYPTVQWMQGKVVAAAGRNGAFELTTAAGESYQAKKLLFATGLRDVLPNLEGLEACWGKSVLHCPYCHGYEMKGVATGILANGEEVYSFAPLIANWTDQLTIYTNGPAKFDLQQLPIAVQVEQRPIQQLLHQEGQLKGIVLEDGKQNFLEALYFHPAFEQHCSLPEELGCALTTMGHLQVDDFQQTTVEGIFAAGDCTTLLRAISGATAQGTKAGAFLNHQLIMDGL